jgi:hypothetical protein
VPAGTEYPRIAGTGYARIADAGMVFYPWWVAGVDSSMNFGSWIRVYKVYIRADFTRCHIYP